MELKFEEGHCALAFIKQAYSLAGVDFDKILNAGEIIKLMEISDSDKQKILERCNKGFPYGASICPETGITVYKLEQIRIMIELHNTDCLAYMQGCEIDADYFASGVERVQTHVSQMDMFIEPPEINFFRKTLDFKVFLWYNGGEKNIKT